MHKVKVSFCCVPVVQSLYILGACRIIYTAVSQKKYIKLSLSKAACCGVHNGTYPNCKRKSSNKIRQIWYHIVELCNPECSNGGECYYDAGLRINKCSCPSGYRGDGCEEGMVQL